VLIMEFCPYMPKGYTEISFSPEQEEKICSRASGDVMMKLELVKICIDMIVKLASWYSLENGTPFSQLIQIGIFAVAKASENYCNSENISFVDYLCNEVMRAMIEYSESHSSHLSKFRKN